jgi:protein-tyrosine phosphatase
MFYQTLDYTKECVNFRDIGEFVNFLAGKKIVPEKRLYRGGKIDHVMQADDIGNPQTIVNLRQGDDAKRFGAEYFHFGISNAMEKYETKNRMVRHWLNQVVKIFENPQLKSPILIHCTSGKDRTGIVTAALLKILEIPQEIIVEEYLLSDGGVKKEWILLSLNGFANPPQYFHRVNLEQVKKNFLT